MMNGRRTGMSLVEVLVVIAIISVMLLLLLPAVNAVREMGRRTQCINNQRNLTYALINYEGAQGAFPAAVGLCDQHVHQSLGIETGVGCMGPNWATQILGFMEENEAYEKLVECVSLQWHASDDCPHRDGGVGAKTPAFMVCPSAPAIHKKHRSERTGLAGLAKGNYAASLGSEHYRTAIEDEQRVVHDQDDRFQVGAMAVIVIPNFDRLVRLTRRGDISGEWKLAHGYGVTTQRFKDGLSNTVIISEVLAWDGNRPGTTHSEDIRGVWTSPSMGASTYTHKYGPNSRMPDRINSCDHDIPRELAMYCEEAVVQGHDASETWASARSAHVGGVVAALADGSVRFFDDQIHLPVWQRLATRAGGDH